MLTMFTRVFLSLALLVALPAWSQVSTTDGGIGLAMTDQMRTPPLLSDSGYSTVAGSQARSNYLRVGLTFTTGYSDNVLGYSSNPISDVDYSLYPTIELDKRTTRLRMGLHYSPGFTVYQHTSTRNQSNQSVGINIEYLLSPHVTVALRDIFLQTSSVVNASTLTGEGGVGPPLPVAAVIAPVGDQLSNVGNAELTYQFSPHGMVGASGTLTNLHYPHPEEVPGLYDSSSTGGSGFYNHRLSSRNYVGVNYRYLKTLAYPVGALSEVESHTILLVYTGYLKPNLSVAFSGGPQHYDISQSATACPGLMGPYIDGKRGVAGRSYQLFGNLL